MSIELETALIAAIVSIATSALTALLTYRRFKHEFALDFAAEKLVKRLLSVPGWEWRSFDQIQLAIGGFEGDELRRVLVRAGAFRGYHRETKKEMWSLLSRNPKAKPPANQAKD